MKSAAGARALGGNGHHYGFFAAWRWTHTCLRLGEGQGAPDLPPAAGTATGSIGDTPRVPRGGAPRNPEREDPAAPREPSEASPKRGSAA